MPASAGVRPRASALSACLHSCSLQPASNCSCVELHFIDQRLQSYSEALFSCPWGRDSDSCHLLSIWDHACRFTFPSAEHLGQSVLSVKDLSHGYQDRRLFDHANMELEKGERVAIMGTACPCGILDWLIEDALVCSHVLVFSRSPPHMALEKGKRVAIMGTPGTPCSTTSAGPRAWTGLCTAVSWGMCWTVFGRHNPPPQKANTEPACPDLLCGSLVAGWHRPDSESQRSRRWRGASVV